MPTERHQVAVGLVANGGPEETISDVLVKNGFAPQPIDCRRATKDLRDVDGPVAIVVWMRDAAISAVPGLSQLLAKQAGDSRVVMIYESIQRWEVRAALVSGVAGIVTYDEIANNLGPCLRAVRVGQICVPRRHWRQIEPPALSTREKQILGLVVMGYMNSQIAARLFLAESTVKSHLSSAFGKLGVRSRNEAVDLIVNSERGLGMGILALGGEPLDKSDISASATA